MARAAPPPPSANGTLAPAAFQRPGFSSSSDRARPPPPLQLMQSQQPQQQRALREKRSHQDLSALRIPIKGGALGLENSGPLSPAIASPHQRLRHKLSAKALGASAMMRGESNESWTSGQSESAASWQQIMAEREQRKTASSSNNATDDDAGSISSFGCSLAAEFSRQQHMRNAEMGPARPDDEGRQLWLDNMFGKLTRKGNKSAAAAAARRAAIDAASSNSQRDDRTVTNRSHKGKPHFLDLTAHINPVPKNNASSTISRSSSPSNGETPRAPQMSRFASHTGIMPPPSPSPRPSAPNLRPGHQPSSSDGGNADLMSISRPQMLRSRRSAESLSDTRRRQKDDWAAAGKQITDDGLPSLPQWARESNSRCLSPVEPGLLSPTYSMHSASEHQTAYSTPRPVHMGRTASNEVPAHRTPPRPALMARAASSQAAPTMQHHSKSSVSSNRSRRPLSPTEAPSHSSLSQRSFSSLRDAAMRSPVSSQPPPLVNSSRGSISSSSGGSVPATPVSQTISLPSIEDEEHMRPDFHGSKGAYVVQDDVKTTPLYAGANGGLAKQKSYQSLHHVTPRAAPRTSSRNHVHAADIFAHQQDQNQASLAPPHDFLAKLSQQPIMEGDGQKRPLMRSRAMTDASSGRGASARAAARAAAARLNAAFDDSTGAAGNASSGLGRSASQSSGTGATETEEEEASRLSYLSGCSATSSSSSNASVSSAAPSTSSAGSDGSGRLKNDWASSIGRRFARAGAASFGSSRARGAMANVGASP